MNDPVSAVRYVLASLPDDPSEVTEEHVAKITAGVGVNVRLGNEVRQRQEKLARSIEAGDRSAGAVKRLKKIGRQIDRIFEAEAMLKPFVDRALEIEMEGETF
jgi:hypothetical protein